MTASRAITCPSCGGSIAIKAAGYTVSVGCQYCGALLDVANPDVAVISQYHGAMAGLAIPLGRRGTLFGGEWEVIGALARSDGDVDWTEFLLFNPYAGYRWLVLSEGEWQFGTMLLDRAEDDGGGAVWRGQRYSQDYEPATTETTRVVGEFYWRVRAGDQVSATTYSRGNETLSAEWSDDEINWTQLVPVSERDVGAAFGLSPPGGFSPSPGGFGRKGVSGLTANVSENSDTPGTRYTGTMEAGLQSTANDLWRMFTIGAATLLALMILMTITGWSTAKVQNRTSVTVDGPEQSLTIGTIQVSRAYQSVKIEADASDFTNRWIDIDYTLVDRKTQRAFTAYGVVEKYAGVDSDGSWTEGSTHTATLFSHVPRGSYDVVADLSAKTWNDPAASSFSTMQGPSDPWAGSESIEVLFAARTGGFLWGNFWLAAVMLFGIPILIVMARIKWGGED